MPTQGLLKERSLYLTLGLEPDSPSVDIKRAYRNLSLRLHPDASRNPLTATRFDMVSKAYASLSVKNHGCAVSEITQLRDSGQDDLFTLGSVLICDPDPMRRHKAATRLGLSGKRSAWIFLRKGLYDAEPGVVQACIRAAAVLGLAQGSGEIANAYQRAGSVLRDAILEVAQATKDDVFKSTLQAAACDSDFRRSTLAYNLLAQLTRLEPSEDSNRLTGASS